MPQFLFNEMKHAWLYIRRRVEQPANVLIEERPRHHERVGRKVLGCCRNFWGDFGGNAFTDGLVSSLNNEKIV